MEKTLDQETLKKLLDKGARLDAAEAFCLAEHFYSLADYAAAYHWYEVSAQKDDPPPMAYYYLGYACQNGCGVEVDQYAAFLWYQKAAKEDIPQAYYNLALFYQNGIVVNKDEDLALHCLQKGSHLLDSIIIQEEKRKEELIKAKQQLHIVQAELASCRERVSGLEQVEHKLIEEETSRKNLQNQYRLLIEKNNELLQKTERLGNDNATKGKYVLELEKKLKEQQTELTEQKAELAEQKRLHARVTQDIENISKSQHALEADLASQIRRLDGERAALSEGLRQKEAAIRDLNEDLRKKEDTLAGMANTLAEKEKALAEKENQRAFLQDICAKQRKTIKHIWCGLAGLAVLVLLIIF